MSFLDLEMGNHSDPDILRLGATPHAFNWINLAMKFGNKHDSMSFTCSMTDFNCSVHLRNKLLIVPVSIPLCTKSKNSSGSRW